MGYARVSTDGQTLLAQQSALVEAGCAKVFAEKQSGAKTDRAQLAKAIAALTEGDTLIVTKLDRLARSTRDLLNTLAEIAQRGASFKSLSDQWADTTSAHGRLMLTVRWAGRVRASPNPCSHQRRANQGASSGREVWAETKANRSSAARSIDAKSCWGGAGRYCAQLRPQPFDNIEARHWKPIQRYRTLNLIRALITNSFRAH